MSRWRTVAVAVIVLVVAAAALFDPDPRPVATAAGTSAVLPPTVAEPNAQSDAWFCAGGTAVDGGAAVVAAAALKSMLTTASSAYGLYSTRIARAVGFLSVVVAEIGKYHSWLAWDEHGARS